MLGSFFPEYLIVTSLDAKLVADHSVRKLIIIILMILSLPVGITNAAYPRKPDAHPHPRSSFQIALELFCSLKNNSLDPFHFRAVDTRELD